MPKKLTLDVLRERKGLTQHQLAEQSGVSRVTIATLELGEHKPTQATLDKLAAMLGERVYKAKYGWRKTYVKRGRPRQWARQTEGERAE